MNVIVPSSYNKSPVTMYHLTSPGREKNMRKSDAYKPWAWWPGLSKRSLAQIPPLPPASLPLVKFLEVRLFNDCSLSKNSKHLRYAITENLGDHISRTPHAAASISKSMQATAGVPNCSHIQVPKVA